MKKTTKKSLWGKKWFKEKPNSIMITPINVWGWLAILVFVFLMFAVAYVNFGSEETPLRSSVGFVYNMILTIGLVGWLFDKKSDKKA